MKMGIFLALALSLSGSFAQAAVRPYRLLFGTSRGFGIAWGLKGRELDFDELIQQGTELDYEDPKNTLENYLVDLADGRVLYTMHGQWAEDLMSDIHPGTNWLQSYTIEEKESFVDSGEKDKEDSAISSAFLLHLWSNANYHSAQDGVLKNIYWASLPRADQGSKKKLLAACEDCQPQFEAQMKRALGDAAYAAYQEEFYSHTFTYGEPIPPNDGAGGKVELIPFQLHAEGCWWSPGTMEGHGTLRLYPNKAGLKLEIADWETTKKDSKGCSGPKP